MSIIEDILLIIAMGLAIYSTYKVRNNNSILINEIKRLKEENFYLKGELMKGKKYEINKVKDTYKLICKENDCVKVIHESKNKKDLERILKEIKNEK